MLYCGIPALVWIGVKGGRTQRTGAQTLHRYNTGQTVSDGASGYLGLMIKPDLLWNRPLGGRSGQPFRQSNNDVATGRRAYPWSSNPRPGPSLLANQRPSRNAASTNAGARRYRH